MKGDKCRNAKCHYRGKSNRCCTIFPLGHCAECKFYI